MVPLCRLSRRRHASYRRRVHFAGAIQFTLAKALGPSARPLTLRAFEWLFQSSFDVIECLRTASIVPAFGRPAAAVASAPGPTPQHPRYLGYWWDAGLRSMVGLHVGVDLLRHGRRYYPIEFNLGAALRPSRRLLYADPVDPLALALAEAASRLGFAHIRCHASRWSEEQREELVAAGRAFGVDVAAVGRAEEPSLPVPLASETLYVVFDYQHSPIHFLTTNQAATASWLYQSIAQDSRQKIVGQIETSERLWIPPEAPGGRWPNLVVKLGGGFSGKSVAVARVRSEKEALDALGMKTCASFPKVLRRGPLTRLRAALGRHQRPLFQQYVAPELDEIGRPQVLRAHLLVSPRLTSLLSAHRVVSRKPLPERAPTGLIDDDDCYIVNYSRGADYAPVDRATLLDLREVAGYLGRVADRTIRARLVVEP